MGAQVDQVRTAYEAVHAPLWRAVLAYSGSRDVADEAVAEAFAQLLRRDDGVDDPAAWAWRAAFRIAAGELKRRSGVATPGAVPDLGVTVPDPALDEVPAPDLWDEASQRTADGSVGLLAACGERPGRRPGPWLTAAAVAAAVLAVGTTALILNDDDQAVDTTPVTQPSPAAGTTVVGDTCTVGIVGDPIVMEPGPADPPLFDTSGQPEGQLVAHTMLGSQLAELHVPGLVLDDLVGERVEEIELQRGTAAIWFGPDFVQVRWFTGGQKPCESFTMTVSGGTEDGNRHAAVDFAERILLPSDRAESPDAERGTIEGEWQLESSRVDGVATASTGQALTFSDGTAEWTDGCSTFSGGYGPVDDGGARVGVVTFTDVTSSAIACPTTPTAAAVQAVMGAEQIAVSVEGELLVLSADGAVLTLRPAEPM